MGLERDKIYQCKFNQLFFKFVQLLFPIFFTSFTIFHTILYHKHGFAIPGDAVALQQRRERQAGKAHADVREKGATGPHASISG